MSRIPELRAELVEAAACRAETNMDPRARGGEALGTRTPPLARRTIRGARRLPLLAAVLVALLLSAAVALAASGLIQIGAPVRPLPGESFTATSGFGVPIAASVRVLAISVPDPDGGPPWGLRYLRTTRGVGCVQAGRVLDGHLGVLGQDGAFADDGRFHELPADVFEPLGCAPPDGAGRAFVGVGVHGLPASGTLDLGCAGGVAQAHAPATSYVRVQRSSGSHGACPPSDERLVLYGLLGPRARAILYTEGRTRVTVPVRGPLGAYLVVRTAHGARQSLTIDPLAMLAIDGHDVEVRYAGGQVCRIGALTDVRARHSCPPVGYVAPPALLPSARALAAPVSVRVGPLYHHATAGHPPARIRRVSLTVSFHAPRAVSDAASEYLVAVVHVGGRRRADCGVGVEPVNRDVRRGERLRVAITLAPACAGRWEGRVLYLRQRPGGGGMLVEQLRVLAQALQEARDGRAVAGTVGGFAFRLP